ncbi:MAG: ATP-binding protein [Bacteroidales bacterium]|nr:ATP-binding protein [Candidatus Physcocola equi]
MRFVDRNKEKKRLEKFLSMPESQLIVVYGRRRIGKSTLIRQVMESQRDVYFQADETNVANQIAQLAKCISFVKEGFDKVNYPDWDALLESLNHRIEEKLTLCLDEFPYLVKACPELPSILQRFCDSKRSKFHIILCGSSQQSMYAEVLNESSPLYGRADCIMHLQPISVRFLGEAMGIDDPIDIIRHYSVWGGVPRYWQMCLNEGDFETSLKMLLLSPDGSLNEEPNRLLRDEMRDLMMSRSILSVIGAGANRLSEIASRIGKNATELSVPIRRLLDMGFLEKEIPFGENEKSSKHTLYKLRDPFMNAFYRFVAPNSSLIAMQKEEVVWNIVNSGLPQFEGECWERLCREFVSGGIFNGVQFGKASRWWGSVYDDLLKENRSIEIDVIAESFDGKHLLVGECKWTGADYAQRLLSELHSKVQLLPFAKKYKSVSYALFLKEKPLDNAADTLLFFPQDIVSNQ